MREERDLQLRADAVGARDEHRLAILAGLEPEQAAKGTDLGENAARECRTRETADAADRFIARVDVDARRLVVH